MDPIEAVNQQGNATSSTQTTAQNAFGLGFEDLLKIVLTQLTYQDPLKPIENFEFVSQLAQFTQIQQTQTMSNNIEAGLSADTTLQATGLLGRTVEIPAGAATLRGKVTAVAFQNGQPRLTITTTDNRNIDNLSLSAISRITEGN